MKHLDSLENGLHNEKILLAKQGNQEAFEWLLESYRPLISSLVKSTLNESPFADSDYEDLYQEAVILFFRALKRYDLDQDGVAFGLFAKICIRNGLSTQAKKMRSRLYPLPLEVDAEVDELDKETVEERVIQEERYHSLYNRIRDVLTAYENSVWWLYTAGCTAKEIAARLEKDEKSVQNAIYRIRHKLRTVLPHP